MVAYVLLLRSLRVVRNLSFFLNQSPATYVMSCRTSTFQFTVVSCRARQEGTRHSFGHLFLPLNYNILIFCRSNILVPFRQDFIIYDSGNFVGGLISSKRYFVFRDFVV